MSETVLYVIQILMLVAGFGLFPLIGIISQAYTPRELVCYPVTVFLSLRKYLNKVGSAIVTGVLLIFYPAALSGAAMYCIIVGSVRAFCWVFRNREKEAE